MKEMIRSKKWWYAVTGLTFIIMAVYLKADTEVIISVSGIVCSLIFGQGLSDNGSKRPK